MSAAEPPGTPTPRLRILTPNASPEEVAALVVALASLRPASSPTVRRSVWADPARTVRVRYSHGPGGWRSSGLPR